MSHLVQWQCLLCPQRDATKCPGQQCLTQACLCHSPSLLVAWASSLILCGGCYWCMAPCFSPFLFLPLQEKQGSPPMSWKSERQDVGCDCVLLPSHSCNWDVYVSCPKPQKGSYSGCLGSHSSRYLSKCPSFPFHSPSSSKTQFFLLQLSQVSVLILGLGKESSCKVTFFFEEENVRQSNYKRAYQFIIIFYFISCKVTHSRKTRHKVFKSKLT